MADPFAGRCGCGMSCPVAGASARFVIGRKLAKREELTVLLTDKIIRRPDDYSDIKQLIVKAPDDWRDFAALRPNAG